MEIAIIGGGVAGLSAGIYAQKSGLQAHIYESHIKVGGQCTTWKRKGYHIDNCVHWMIGTNPDKDIYNVWNTVGVKVDKEHIIQHEYFLKVHFEGQTLTFYREFDKLEEELLRVAPEDKKEIKNLIKILKKFSAIELPCKPKEQMGFWENMKLVKKMFKAIPIAVKYHNMTMMEYANLFKSRLIREAIYNYMPEQYNVVSVFYVYANFAIGNAGLPKGGSDSITLEMEKEFLRLGGKISCKKKASKIVVENNKANKIIFEDGTQATADYIIPACDTDVTFNLIGREYMDEHFKLRYTNKESFPVSSVTNLYFGVKGGAKDLPTMIIFECEPYNCGGKKFEKIILNNYAEEDSFAPQGDSIVQVLIVQNEEEYYYWKNLEKEEYKKQKQILAQEIQERIEKFYPQLKEKLECVECVTPVSFERFCGAYKGAYMSFIQTTTGKKEVHLARVNGIDNLILAGQWLQAPGGLPNAVITGKFAIERLLKQENKLEDFCKVK